MFGERGLAPIGGLHIYPKFGIITLKVIYRGEGEDGSSHLF